MRFDQDDVIAHLSALFMRRLMPNMAISWTQIWLTGG